MSFISSVKESLKAACYGFCCLTVLYSFIMLLIYQGVDANMSVRTVLLFYPLSFVITFVCNFMNRKKWNSSLKSFVLYVTILASAGLFIFLPHQNTLKGSSLVILFAMITLSYWFGAAIFFAVYSQQKKKENRESEYTGVYNKK